MRNCIVIIIIIIITIIITIIIIISITIIIISIIIISIIIIIIYQPIGRQYSPLSGAAAAMKDQDVTTVLLGASSLFSNGSMLAPAGTAMVNNNKRSVDK